MINPSRVAALAVALAAGLALPALSDEVVNVYSARHYDSDLLLYDAFAAQTGIAVIEDDAGPLIERIKAEGANSPADVFLTADAGNLAAAAAEGLFQPIASEVLSQFVSLATPVTAEIDQVLTRQFEPARTLDLLVEGGVRFQIQLEQGNEDLDVGASDAPWTPIGWSGFRSPGRYATTVVSVRRSRLLRFEHAALETFFSAHPAVGVVFLQAVLGGSLDLLATIRDRIATAIGAPADFAHTLHAEGEEEAYNRAPPTLTDLLCRSAFFDVFEESQLEWLAAGADSRYFCRGEPVLRQGAGDSSAFV